MIFRTKNELDCKNRCDYLSNKSKNSWVNDKDFDTGWDTRYLREAKIICEICKKEGSKRILELGSGPGRLSQIIMKKTGITDYTLIDLEGAKKLFVERGYNGKFMIKDLENFFDVSGVGGDFDLIIMNDFLEHIRNPSQIVSSVVSLLSKKGTVFCSIPNWRMGHLFFYRGLFDFDNFIYFMLFHGLIGQSLFKSNLKTPKIPRLQSENALNKDMLRSWNFYCLFRKEEIKK